MLTLPAVHVRNRRSAAATGSASLLRGCVIATTTARMGSTEGPAATKPTAITPVVQISSNATTRTAFHPCGAATELRTAPMDQVNYSLHH